MGSTGEPDRKRRHFSPVSPTVAAVAAARRQQSFPCSEDRKVLKVFPYPITIPTLQFAVGTVFTLLMWVTNIYKIPKISSAQLFAILPLAMVHTLGNLFTNMSLGKVVSFTHTIKAMEPFFSVLLSALFLRELPSIWVVSSLAPIVGGVALASMTETSFNWAGFWAAMASNVTLGCNGFQCYISIPKCTEQIAHD